MITLIANVGENMELGKNGELVFHIKDDMKFFRKTTEGHTVIMGRKTYVSLPSPLKSRENVVISRNPDVEDTRVTWYTSIEEVYERFKNNSNEVFIIGGASIYKAFLPFCDRIYLTEVKANADADAFFPDFDKSLFNKKLIETVSSDNGLTADIYEYSRK